MQAPFGSRTIMSGVSRRPSLETDSFSDVVAVRHHAGALDDAPELDLAPSSALIRRAQRADQFVGLDLKRLMRVGERSQLLVELGVRAGSLLFDVLEFAVDACERFLQRLNEIGNRLVAPVELDAC